MSSHLRDVLMEFSDAEGRASGSTAPDPHLEARVLGRRISRRRAVRTGAVSLTTAAVVVGAAAGVNALADRQEPLPPATTSPSPTVTTTPTPTRTPTPTPSPTPTQTSEVTLPPVTVHPLLPEAVPMPPGTFARTEAGWVLVQTSIVTGNGEGDGPIERTYFYLVDPTGTRYEVPFNTDRSVNLVDWLPGTPTAVVQLGGPGDWSGGVSVMNLETGTFRDLAKGIWGSPLLTADGTVVVAGSDSTVSAYAADGTQTASVDVGGWGSVRLDPSRTRLAVTVQATSFDGFSIRLLSVDLQPLRAPSATTHLDGRACVEATWLDESTLSAVCPDRAQPGTSQYWTVPLDGTPELLPVTTTSDELRVTTVRAGGRTYVSVPGETAPDTYQTGPDQLFVIGPDGTLDPVEPALGGALLAAGDFAIGPRPLGNGRSGDVIGLNTRTGDTWVVVPHSDVWDGNAKQVTYTNWVPAY